MLLIEQPAYRPSKEMPHDREIIRAPVRLTDTQEVFYSVRGAIPASRDRKEVELISEGLVLFGARNVKTTFLDMVESSHRMVEVLALGKPSASLKFFDAIPNRLFGCADAIEQDLAIRFKQDSYVQLFPGGHNGVRLHANLLRRCRVTS